MKSVWSRRLVRVKPAFSLRKASMQPACSRRAASKCSASVRRGSVPAPGDQIGEPGERRRRVTAGQLGVVCVSVGLIQRLHCEPAKRLRLPGTHAMVHLASRACRYVISQDIVYNLTQHIAYRISHCIVDR